MRTGVRASVRSVGDALRPPWGLLGVLAGNSLLFRGLSSLAEWRPVSFLAGEGGEVVLAVASITLRTSSTFALVGFGFEWLMLAYLVFAFLPRVFARWERAPAVFGTGRFRLTATLVVLGIAFPIAAAVPSPVGTSPVVGGSPGLPSLVLIVGFAAFLVLLRADLAGAPPAALIEFTERIFPQEFEEEEKPPLLREDLLGRLNRFGLLTMIVAYVVLLCGVMGALAAFASFLFPLPELVVLAGATAALAGRWLPGSLPLRTRTVDVEASFFRLVGYFLASRKGYTVLLVAFAGSLSMVVGFLSLLASVGLVLSTPSLLIRFPTSPVRVWAAAGYAVCLAIPGLYAAWFWVRVTIRVPRFLADWEAAVPGEAPIGDVGDLPPTVTRPWGVLLPPTLPLLLAAHVAPTAGLLVLDERVCDDLGICRTVGHGLLETLRRFPLLDWPFGPLEPSTVAGFPGMEAPAFALGWPLAVGVVAWSVRWTRRHDPQPPGTDNLAIVAAALVQVGWVALFIDVAGVTLAPTEWVVGFFLPPFLVGLHYAPDLTYGGVREKFVGGGVAGAFLLVWVWLADLGVGLAAIAGLELLLLSMLGVSFLSNPEDDRVGDAVAAAMLLVGAAGLAGLSLWLRATGRPFALNQLLGWTSLVTVYVAGYYLPEWAGGSRRTRVGMGATLLAGLAVLATSIRWSVGALTAVEASSVLDLLGSDRPVFAVAGFLLLAGGMVSAMVLRWVYVWAIVRWGSS